MFIKIFNFLKGSLMFLYSRIQRTFGKDVEVFITLRSSPLIKDRLSSSNEFFLSRVTLFFFFQHHQYEEMRI